MCLRLAERLCVKAMWTRQLDGAHMRAGLDMVRGCGRAERLGRASWLAQRASTSSTALPCRACEGHTQPTRPSHLKAAKKPDLASMLLAKKCLTAATAGAAAGSVLAQKLPAATAASAARPPSSPGRLDAGLLHSGGRGTWVGAG